MIDITGQNVKHCFTQCMTVLNCHAKKIQLKVLINPTKIHSYIQLKVLLWVHKIAFTIQLN